MTKEYIASLKICGLSENEAKVYLSALELGMSSIWDIASHSGVKRPTCYVLLEELTKKGIAKSHNDGKRVVYSVITPKQLAIIEGKEHNAFISLLPQLEGLASKSPSRPNVSYYEGEIGIMEVYNSMLELREKSVILTYSQPQHKVGYSDFLEQFDKVRVMKNIKRLILLPDAIESKPLALRDALDCKETRLLPADKYAPKNEINIYGDTIIYITHSETEPFATKIENSRMAFEEKQKFALLWEMAKS